MVEKMYRLICERCGRSETLMSTAKFEEKRTEWSRVKDKDVCPECRKVWDETVARYWEGPEKTPAFAGEWISIDLLVPSNGFGRIWTRDNHGAVDIYDFNLHPISSGCVHETLKALGVHSWKPMK